MATGIVCFIKRFPHRLPGNAKVIPILVISHIHIMPRSIHWHGVPPKPCHPVIFRRLVKHVPTGRMIYHHTHVSYSKVIGPRYRQIHTVNDIFSFFIIKMSVLHKNPSPFLFSDFIIVSRTGEGYCQVWHNLFYIVGLLLFANLENIKL